MSAFVKLNQTLPTYLEEFLNEDVNCQLIHKKSSTISSLSGDMSFDTSITSNELDLTGNPLEVDLNISAMNSLELEGTPPGWTISEAQHFPMSLTESRDYLNTHINPKESPIPTFCITNGKDRQRTIINGSQRYKGGFKTYSMRIVGFLNETVLSLNYFENEHNKYVRVTPDSTEYKFQRTYNIHGFNLHETLNLECAPSKGCVILKNFWNTHDLEEPFTIQSKIVLKVISGHKKSSIYFLWNQLNILRNLLKIQEDSSVNNEKNTVISSDNLPSRELSNEIRHLCRSKLSIQKLEISEELNLNNLREETILDKLWHLLIRCQNLEDLRYSVCLFITIVKPEEFDETDHILADIVKNYAKWSDFEEKFTLLECLNLLLFIGFEKLKRDYFTIINYIYPMYQEQLQLKWRKMNSFNEKSTEITKIDSNFNRKKYEFIVDLHDLSEMLVFSKRDVKKLLELSSINLNRISKAIFDKCVFDKSDQNKETNVKLLEICCDLEFNDALYKRKKPMTSVYEYVSRVNDSTIKTIFHVSQNSIFPKCIYDFYDENQTDLDGSGDHVNEDRFYVSLLMEANHELFKFSK